MTNTLPLLTIIDVIYTTGWYKRLNYDCKRCFFYQNVVELRTVNNSDLLYFYKHVQFDRNLLFFNNGTGKTYRCSVHN